MTSPEVDGFARTLEQRLPKFQRSQTQSSALGDHNVHRIEYRQLRDGRKKGEMSGPGNSIHTDMAFNVLSSTIAEPGFTYHPGLAEGVSRFTVPECLSAEELEQMMKDAQRVAGSMIAWRATSNTGIARHIPLFDIHTALRDAFSQQFQDSGDREIYRKAVEESGIDKLANLDVMVPHRTGYVDTFKRSATYRPSCALPSPLGDRVEFVPSLNYHELESIIAENSTDLESRLMENEGRKNTDAYVDITANPTSYSELDGDRLRIALSEAIKNGATDLKQLNLVPIIVASTNWEEAKNGISLVKEDKTLRPISIYPVSGPSSIQDLLLSNIRPSNPDEYSAALNKLFYEDASEKTRQAIHSRLYPSTGGSTGQIS